MMHNGNVGVQIEGMCLLRTLLEAANDKAPFQQHAELVIRTIENHIDCVRVQRYGLGFLLMLGGAYNVALASRMFGSVLNVITHSACALIQLNAIVLLQRLSTDERGRERDMPYKIGDALATAMQQHLAHSQIQVAAMTLMNSTCKAQELMTYHRHVVAAMLTHCACEDVQSVGCTYIRLLNAHELCTLPERLTALLSVTIRAMKLHAQSPDVQVPAMEFLGKIAFTQRPSHGYDFVTTMWTYPVYRADADKVIVLVMEILKKHEAHAGVQKAGIRYLNDAVDMRMRHSFSINETMTSAIFCTARRALSVHCATEAGFELLETMRSHWLFPAATHEATHEVVEFLDTTIWSIAATAMHTWTHPPYAMRAFFTKTGFPHFMETKVRGWQCALFSGGVCCVGGCGRHEWCTFPWAAFPRSLQMGGRKASIYSRRCNIDPQNVKAVQWESLIYQTRQLCFTQQLF
jgi:hypothetical protein